jgi:hypothetical protein
MFLNSTLQFYVAGDQFCARAGMSVYIPRNVTESIQNVNSKPVHVQILFAPPGKENYFEQVTPIYDTQPINYTAAAAHQTIFVSHIFHYYFFL